MKRSVAVAASVVAFVLWLFPGAALAATYTTNSQCLDCHARSGSQHDHAFVLDSATVTFTAGAVDFSSACSKCHWVGDSSSPRLSMPYRTSSHNFASASSCSGTGCHLAPYGTVNGMAVPHSLVTSMSSYFFSATSYRLDSETLHRIHTNPRWPALADVAAGTVVSGQPLTRKALYTLRCASCHAAASCDDCHTGASAAISPDHSAHTTGTVVSTIGHGTPTGDPSVPTTAALGQTCVTGACHTAAGTDGGVHIDSAASGAVKTGSWTLVSGSTFYGGSAIKTNLTTASVGADVSGAEFSVFGFTLAAGGSELIKVDGSTVATVSCYSPTQSGSAELYRGTLTPGPHTVTVASSGLAGKGNGKYVTLDCIVVYATAYADFVSHSCADCHVPPSQSANGIDVKDRTLPHGYDATLHAGVEGSEIATAFGEACTACHTMDLAADHAGTGSCNACHTLLPGDTVTAAEWVRGIGGWDGRCDACHGNPACAVSQVRRAIHFHFGHDDVPPVTTIHGADLGKWTSGPVGFSLTATDNVWGSGVAGTSYRLGTGADTAYDGGTVTVSAEGTTVVSYWSVDASGNVETPSTANILVDTAAPIVTGATTVEANAAGWFRTDVTVHFTASDAYSGVATVSPDVILTGEGTDLSAAGSATDTAGNRGTTVLSGIKIDRVAPVTSSDATSTYFGSALVTLTATDGLSGVAHTFYSFDGGTTVREGASVEATRIGMYDLTFWSVDAAGNAEAPHYAEFMVAPEGAVFTTNHDCLDCHANSGSRHANSGVSQSFTVTFTVGSVDYGTACRKCHWVGDPTSPSTAHPYQTLSHNYSTSNCTGSGCHAAPFGTLNGMAVPHSLVATMGSYFYSAASYKVDAETLHRIHSNPRWPAGADIVTGGPIPGQTSKKALYSLRCASCHATAACDDCHEAITTQHSVHSTSTDIRPYAAGTPAGDQGVLSVLPRLTCTSTNCHPLSAVSAGAAYDNASSTVVKTGAWTAVSGVVYSSSSASKSNANPSGVSLTTSGTEFSYYGFTLPTGGSALVKVDDAVVATISCYSAAQSGSTELFRGQLSPGSHTIAVENAQIAGKGGGKFITFDGFAVRPSPYVLKDGVFRPSCGVWGCHIDKVIVHGYKPEIHASSQGSSSTPDLAGKVCGDCHSMDLLTEHVTVGGCNACHQILPGAAASAADIIIASGGWDGTCAACHDASSPILQLQGGIHTREGNHDVSGLQADAFCERCHPREFPGGGAYLLDLPTIHSQATTTVSGVFYEGCNVCHRPGATLDNVCASCHPPFDQHVVPSHTSRYDLSMCGGSQCHTSTVTIAPPGTASDLVEIHADRSNQHNSRCSQCHQSTDDTVTAAIASRNTSCGACHPAVEASTGVGHNGLPAAHAGTALGVLCQRCHPTSQLPELHAPYAAALAYSSSCAICHQNGNPDRIDWTTATAACSSCHPSVDTSTGEGHPNLEAAHASPDLGSLCRRCHTTSDLPALHSAEATALGYSSSCAMCHENTDPQRIDWATATAACSSCHPSIDASTGAGHSNIDTAHAGTPLGALCTGCHTTSALPALHSAEATALGYSSSCAMCHENTDPQRIDWATATAACSSCHPSVDTSTGAGHPSLPSIHLSSSITTRCQDAGCHESNLASATGGLPDYHAGYVGAGKKYPQYASSCALCHQNTDPNRINWTTATARCTTCHPGEHPSIHPATYSADSECLNCHSRAGSNYSVHAGATVTFTVDPVDYSTACAKCHWVGNDTTTTPTASHPYYTASHTNNTVLSCAGNGCHTAVTSQTASFGDLNGMAVPHQQVASMGCYFYSATSYQVDTETLHRIHANPRWPATADITTGGPIPGFTDNTNKGKYTFHCASCHAAAACDACHTGLRHSTHTTPTVGVVSAYGTPRGNQGVVTTVSASLTCLASACHARSAISAGTTRDSLPTTNQVSILGTYYPTPLAGPQFIGGAVMRMQCTTGSISITTTGSEFAYYGYRYSNGGVVTIQVDGSTVATASCYAASTSGSTLMYRGPLAAGTHTISVSGATGGKWITFDAFIVYGSTFAPFKPSCVSCHGGNPTPFVGGWPPPGP